MQESLLVRFFTGLSIVLAVLFLIAGAYLNLTDRNGDRLTITALMFFLVSRPWRWAA